MDYDDILNATWEDIPEPKTLPDGGWLLKGRSVAWILPKKEEDSAKVLFGYKPKSPVSVDDEALEALGADYDLEMNDLNFSILIKSAADWNKVKKHLEIAGIELDGPLFGEDGKLAFAKAFKGTEVVAQVTTQHYEQNGEAKTGQNLSKFQAVEA